MKRCSIWLCVLVLLAGCGQNQRTAEQDVREPDLQLQTDQPEKVNEDDVKNQRQQNDFPEDVKKWISSLNQLDQFPVWHSKISGDSLYVYVSWGEKPTGGYRVEVADKTIGEEEIELTVHFHSPDPDAMVTQALTYPYTVAVLEASEKPVKIHAAGRDVPQYVQTIRGIETLPGIVAGSDRIVLFEPKPGSRVEPGFEVSGLATVFEGTVNYRLLDPRGKVLKEGFTTAADGMNWAYFSFEPDPDSVAEAGEADSITLQLFAIDAENGEEISGFDVSLLLGD